MKKVSGYIGAIIRKKNERLIRSDIDSVYMVALENFDSRMFLKVYEKFKIGPSEYLIKRIENTSLYNKKFKSLLDKIR